MTKRKMVSAITALAAVVLLAYGCTVHFTAKATTSAKAGGKVVHTGQPVQGDPAHPVVEAKPIEGTAAVEAGPVEATATAEIKIALPVPKLATGVKEAKAACPNTTEVTNGIDDDCDGQVDENEVGSGPLQVTLWWSSPADMDLEVIGPNETINYKAKDGKSGGKMDKDSRSSCKGDQTIENVFWADKPPKGNYKVKVKYYSSCKDKTAAPSTAFVTVAYQGQILGPFSLEMNKSDVVDMVEFMLDE